MLLLIAAVDRHNCLGYRGSHPLPWHLPEDLKRFRHHTMGYPVIMGRHTFESIGKPLPGRINVVLSKQPDFAPHGVLVAHSLREATDLASVAAVDSPRTARYFVIGGANVFSEAIHDAHILLLTRVETELPQQHDQGGLLQNTYFPVISPDRWTLLGTEPRVDPASGLRYQFEVYVFVTIAQQIRDWANAESTLDPLAQPGAH